MIDENYETKAGRGFLIEWIHVDTVDRGYGNWGGTTVGKSRVEGRGYSGSLGPRGAVSAKIGHE